MKSHCAMLWTPEYGIVNSHWRKRQCRCEDGLYFGADVVTKLISSPKKGYFSMPCIPIDQLLESEPDSWCELDELCSAVSGDFIIFAGSTSWEAAGFIALEHRSSGNLVWLLQLSNAEEFVEISCAGSTVRAASSGYPIRFEWLIPIDSPENFSVSQINEA